MHNHAPLAIAAATFLLITSGCGSGGPETVAVRGRVTFEGQPPGTAGRVIFAPIEPVDGLPLSPGRGAFESDGVYSAALLNNRSGLVPGTYRVSVECWVIPPTPNGPLPESRVPEKYQQAATSDLILKVPQRSGAIQFNIDLE